MKQLLGDSLTLRDYDGQVDLPPRLDTTLS